MPGLGGSDGSPLVAWPFVVKFLVPPGETPRGLWAPLSPPPAKGPPRNCARMPRGSPRSPPRSIIRSKIAPLSLSLSLVDGPLRWLESLPFVHEYLRPCFEHGLLAPSLVILSRELSSIIS